MSKLFNHTSKELNNEFLKIYEMISGMSGNPAQPQAPVGSHQYSASPLQPAGSAVALAKEIFQPPPYHFMLEVAKGNVKGHSIVNKFGHNPAADSGEDIWGGGGKYTFFPTTPVLIDIVSSDDADNGATATGAIVVVIQGLDADWKFQEVTITMNGTTPVTTMTETWMRLFRAFVRIAGSSETNEGNITAYTRGTPTQIGIYIGADGGQTQQTIYTVPAGKSAYFIKGYVGLKNSTFQGEDGVFRWMLRVNAFGPGGAWLTQGEIGLINIGSSYWQYEYGAPAGPIFEKTDIRIELTDASDTMDTVAGFDLVLVDNNI